MHRKFSRWRHQTVSRDLNGVGLSGRRYGLNDGAGFDLFFLFCFGLG